MSGGRAPYQKGCEEWRQVTWAPDYAVSSFGRVMRLVPAPGSRVCKELKPYVTDKGYLRCVLRTGNSSVTARIHRLVCEAFHGPATDDRPIVRHLDGNPANKQVGMQTVTIPPGGGYVVEMRIPDEGFYPFVTHSFAYTGKGALGLIKVGNPPPLGEGMSH